jgi:hypothetical protein
VSTHVAFDSGYAQAVLRMSVLLGPKPRLVKDQDAAAVRMPRLRRLDSLQHTPAPVTPPGGGRFSVSERTYPSRRISCEQLSGPR